MFHVLRALLHGLVAIPVWACGIAGPGCAFVTWFLGVALTSEIGLPGILPAVSPAFLWGVWFGWNKENL